VEFQRIKRLPPYVFSIIDSMKMEARHRGEDIVDFGMGNPDLPTPPHVVAKLIEAASKPANPRERALPACPSRLKLPPPAFFYARIFISKRCTDAYRRCGCCCLPCHPGACSFCPALHYARNWCALGHARTKLMH